ncbi:D-alanyl-D-alanine carboxypeptidase (penicillin-binding protein 4) [Prevotella dentalis DSM 3688]|nr:D-alanyl-D-alanine carboxypeptidase [Prevotella dentalis]AGB29259.1 D-alanyl-D-alanine carboxypeptidase (penicillin-binding protein 4) [Prevotella dentalis DSM 3688]
MRKQKNHILKLTHTLRPCLMGLLLATLLGSCSSDNSKGRQPAADTSSQHTLPVDPALRRRLADLAAAPRPQGRLGFHVYDLTADRPVYGLNERKALPSASCLKLLSGVAGLHLLGTRHLYATSIYTRGQVVGDTLRGDVTFRAGLDPQLNGPDLGQFAAALRRKGIRRIGGRLLLDLQLHDPVRSEAHWYPWDLSFSHYGLLYKGAPRVQKELTAALRARGVSVADSQVALGRTPRGSHCIFRFYRSVDRVTERMWKHSSNTQATALLYTIGHRADPRAEPTAAGVAYLRRFMREELGLRDSALVVHDGCGLCTHNRLSPEALTTVLRYAYRHRPIYRLLLAQLSIAGVDGTLRRELAGPKTRGKIRAKTGTLSHPYGISSLAGYCRGSNGHLLAFAIMDSEMSVLDARVLQRKLGEALVARPEPGR